jgi:hypothetical protein
MDVVAEITTFGLHPDILFPRACCCPFITCLSSRVSSSKGFLITWSSRERPVRPSPSTTSDFLFFIILLQSSLKLVGSVVNTGFDTRLCTIIIRWNINCDVLEMFGANLLSKSSIGLTDGSKCSGFPFIGHVWSEIDAIIGTVIVYCLMTASVNPPTHPRAYPLLRAYLYFIRGWILMVRCNSSLFKPHKTGGMLLKAHKTGGICYIESLKRPRFHERYLQMGCWKYLLFPHSRQHNKQQPQVSFFLFFKSY